MEGEITYQFRSIKSHISEQSFSVPEELIEEILSRLPVKSLLQFRCVSKPWRSLIGSKHFIKKHLVNSTKNPSFAHHNIVLNSIRPLRGLKQRSLLSMLNDPLTDQFTFCDLENVNRLDSMCIVGCSNGLLCILHCGKYFTLWNPSTKKTKNLPDIDHRIKHGHIANYGFGYDDLSGDYLVFGIASFFWSNGRYEAICKVYSLETNSWKKVKRGNVSPFNNEGKFASGKMHWRSSVGMDWDMIVSFDLRSEVYDVIDLPIKNGDCYKSIGVLGGSLSLLCVHFGYLDIWVIKEYGVKGCWEKVATVSYLDSIVNVPYPSLLAIGPNGEILLSGRSAFGIYSPDGNGFRPCHVTALGEFHNAVIYVESLVPL